MSSERTALSSAISRNDAKFSLSGTVSSFCEIYRTGKTARSVFLIEMRGTKPAHNRLNLRGNRLPPPLHVRIGEPHRCAVLEGDDLLEGLAEIKLEIVPFGPAEMGHAQRIRHLEQGVIAAGDGLLLVDIDRG